ncbi:MAG: hypothetical protein KIT84_34380 [Labilithrix sp.]|nr:hypothetical protein [Labilithrix sp.]MCW5816135.1 hypothetical protein [Labilithrix sp.]
MIARVRLPSILLLCVACGSAFSDSDDPTGDEAGDPTGETSVGPGEMTGEPFDLATTTPSPRAFQGVFATPADGTPLVLSKRDYPAKLDEHDVVTHVVDGRLVFTVPDGALGPLTLRVPLDGGKLGVLSLDVRPAPKVEDPVSMITGLIDGELEAAAEDVAATELLIASGKLPAEARAELDRIQATLNDTRAQFLSFSAAEQEQVATVIALILEETREATEAGDALLDELRSKSLADLTGVKRKLRLFTAHLGLYLTPTLVGVAVGGALGASLGPGGVWLGARTGALVANYVAGGFLKRQKRRTEEAWSHLGSECFRAVDLIASKFKADYTMKAGLPLPLAIDIRTRNLQPSDASDPKTPEWVSTALTAIDQTNRVYATLFPSSAALQFAPLREEEEGLLPLDDGPDERLGRHLWVIDESNPNVRCVVDGTPEEPSMSCRLAAPPSSRSSEHFTFRLRYQPTIGADPVVDSPPMSAELDTSCEYDRLGPYPDGVVGVTRACFDSAGHLLSGEECTWHSNGGCERLRAARWLNGPTLGPLLGDYWGSYSQEADYELYESSGSYTASNATSRGSCHHSGVYDIDGQPQASCGPIKALTPLSISTMGIIQEGLCVAPETCLFAD